MKNKVLKLLGENTRKGPAGLALERLSEDKNSTSREIIGTFIMLKLRTSFY